MSDDIVRHSPKGEIGLANLKTVALEDRINTLLTQDPQKVLVYTQGYDGHCYRTYYYWPHLFPDIDPTNVDQVNSIQYTHGKMRGKSKGPTFSLTYLGTPFTLEANNGFSKAEANTIYNNYHSLYIESDRWLDRRITEASHNGYAELAFGLRLRCPVLRKTILGSRYTPKQAEAEKRTVANAMGGQSYGLLNSRAGVEFQERCLNSEHRLDVKPSAHIHDAQYFLIRNNFKTLKWVNDNLVECIEWQELPELQQVPVKLTGNLGVFYPNWSNEIELKHSLDNKAIYSTVLEGVEKWNQKEENND